MNASLKEWLASVVRMTVVAIVTSVVIIVVLGVAFSDQSRKEQDAIDEIRRGTLATTCVLAIEVRETPDGGSRRPPAAVRDCLQRYGLEA